MSFKAIRTYSAPEMLVKQIFRSLEKGEIKPGDRLPSQRELATTFQVGLSTVREAIKILHAMRYLDVIHGKGTFIAKDALTKEKIPSQLEDTLEAVSLFDLMKAREIIECSAAEIAAETADEEGIIRIQNALEKVEASTHDADDFYQADFEFHIAIAEATNNQAIYELVKLLVDKVHKNHTEFMAESLKNWTLVNLEKSIFTARKIFTYLSKGQGKESARYMRDHLNIVNFELESGYLRFESNKQKKSKAG